MKGKIYTIEEANRTLPLVGKIRDDIRAAFSDINRTLEDYESATNDHAEPSTIAVKDFAISEALDAFDYLIKEMEELGATIKDYETGMVDFYGELNGEIVYLCWTGEESVKYWHKLDEGFSKRRPL